jgi:hypothetical protein
MSDPVSLARGARENLARGLAALQGPGVPQHLIAAAEPIAQAMSALHRIEATQGAARGEAGPTALQGARQALGILQAVPPGSPAVDQALEAIAGSLGLIHQLAQAAAPAQPAAAFAGTVVMNPQQASVVPMSAAPQTQPSQHHPYANYAEPAPQVAYAQPAWQQPAPQPAQQAWPAPAQQAFQEPVPQPAQQAWQQPPQQPAQQAWPAPTAQPAPAMAGGVLRVEAELGAHSATNFYKGLSGNDVIDSGGIFIATYQIPEIGRQLAIKVSMPGGYEFEAMGVVRWTRDAPPSSSGGDSSPGYGAQFTQISQEGRQLVYRYVRNREPLFHDDL